MNSHQGIRVGNKRSIGQTSKFNAGDEDAIADARDSSSLRSRCWQRKHYHFLNKLILTNNQLEAKVC